MDRRTILKAGCALSLISSPVVAKGTPSDVLAIIEEIEAAREKAHAATDLADAIWGNGTRPPWPKVERSAFNATILPITCHRKHYTRSEITEAFELLAHQRIMHRDLMLSGSVDADQRSQSVRQYEQRTTSDDLERAKAIAVLNQQEASLLAWAEASGHKAAQDEANRHYDRKYALEDRIISAPFSTLADAAAVAAYFRSEYGNDLNGAYALQFMAALAGEPMPQSEVNALRDELHS